jgi:hypothetical protein
LLPPSWGPALCHHGRSGYQPFSVNDRNVLSWDWTDAAGVTYNRKKKDVSSIRRRSHVPQVQAAQQRLKHASAPPSHGQVSSSSKLHRHEGHLAPVQMKLVIFTQFFKRRRGSNVPQALAA